MKAELSNSFQKIRLPILIFENIARIRVWQSTIYGSSKRFQAIKCMLFALTLDGLQLNLGSLQS